MNRNFSPEALAYTKEGFLRQDQDTEGGERTLPGKGKEGARVTQTTGGKENQKSVEEYTMRALLLVGARGGDRGGAVRSS